MAINRATVVLVAWEGGADWAEAAGARTPAAAIAHAMKTQDLALFRVEIAIDFSLSL
jgi:hypothetical protein